MCFKFVNQSKTFDDAKVSKAGLFSTAFKVLKMIYASYGMILGTQFNTLLGKKMDK